MTQAKLLQLRKEIKDMKPEFIRQDNPKRMKVNGKWRKPKGVHSKIRHQFKGRRKMPSPGYRSPSEVRGLHISGKNMVIVSSLSDFENLGKDDGVIVSKNVGTRKRLEIFKKVKEMKLHILNLNVDDHIAKIEQFVASKKKDPKKDAKKETKAKESKEHKEKKHDHTKTKEEASEEEKKKAEKQEKDKLLTQKV